MRSTRIAAAIIVVALGLTAVSSRASDATFAGKYSDGNLTLDLAPTGDGYGGTITLHEQQFPATAHADGQGLVGTFTSGSNSFPFTASLDTDTLNLSTGSKTFKLKQLSPAANPLSAPAAPANPLAANSAASDAPIDYTVITTTGSGKSIATQKPNVAKLNDALIATFSDLATYFGNRPALGSAYQDAHDPTSGGATFSVTLNGQNNRGIVSCKLHDGTASVSVIYGRADAPKADWDKLMAPASAPTPQASAASPQGNDVPTANLPLTEYDYPDGTGSIGLPDGWTTQGQSAIGGVAIKGPANQVIFIHNPVIIQVPDSPAVAAQQRTDAQTAQMNQRLAQRNLPPIRQKPLPPMMVAPLSDPIDSVQVLMPQFNKRAAFYNGPSSTFGKFISTREIPANAANAKRAIVDYTITTTLNGELTSIRVQADLMTCPVNNSVWMCLAHYSAQAPEATFDHDLPIMMEIVRSEKVDQQKMAQVALARNQQQYQAGQQMLAAQQQQFQAMSDIYKQKAQTQQDIHDQQQAQTEAGYAAHNQQFNDYELQRSRHAADFNESIIGTRTIYDTVTGESGYANLTDVNGVVDSLNQAALDPNRFVQIPLRDQLYPLPGR